MERMSDNEVWAWGALIGDLLCQNTLPPGLEPRAAQVAQLQSRPGASMRYLAPSLDDAQAQITDNEVPHLVRLMALVENLGFKLCGPEQGYPHLSSDETGNQWGVRATYEERACYITDPKDGCAVSTVPDGWEWWIEEDEHD